MKLKVLGSSSTGNCYILDNGEEALVLECGAPFSYVKSEMKFDISRIVGALVTHEHGDHSKYVSLFLESRIPVYSSIGTANALGYSEIRKIYNMTKFRLGGFSIMSFDTMHDSAEPFGYIINHNETGNILFATDTRYIGYRFKSLSTMMIECNYSKEIIDENTRIGKLHPVVRNRVIMSHMSLDTCIETINANDKSALMRIVLLHTSDGNGNRDLFADTVQKETNIETFAACEGLSLNIDKTPF